MLFFWQRGPWPSRRYPACHPRRSRRRRFLRGHRARAATGAGIQRAAGNLDGSEFGGEGWASRPSPGLRTPPAPWRGGSLPSTLMSGKRLDVAAISSETALAVFSALTVALTSDVIEARSCFVSVSSIWSSVILPSLTWARSSARVQVFSALRGLAGLAALSRFPGPWPRPRRRRRAFGGQHFRGDRGLGLRLLRRDAIGFEKVCGLVVFRQAKLQKQKARRSFRCDGLDCSMTQEVGNSMGWPESYSRGNLGFCRP
jgi:hypothetical protein